MNKKTNVRPLQFVECKGTDGDDGLCFKKRASTDPSEILDPEKLPIPDGEFLKYGQSAERYLKTGKRDSQILREALIRDGVDPVTGPGNILELGCANARVLRWFADWSSEGEAWGVDLDAPMVFWCHQNLSPPFHFAVSTTAPHLFFEDRYFSLTFCMSVFTHVDDLYLSWIQELRRVTKLGGYVYLTVHDENTQRVQEQSNSPFQNKRLEYPSYQKFLNENGDFCACGRDVQSLVSFRREYLIDLASNYFKVVDVIEGAMARSQTGLLLKRTQ